MAGSGGVEDDGVGQDGREEDDDEGAEPAIQKKGCICKTIGVYM
jgi:hypothetical protein